MEQKSTVAQCHVGLFRIVLIISLISHCNCMPVLPCLEGCSCDPQLITMNCSNRGFSGIPGVNFSENVEIGVHKDQINNHVSDENGNVQEAYLKVEELNLEGNDIEVVEDDELGKLKNLKMLTIARNKLSKIGTATFRGLIKMTKLDVSFNRIQTLRRDSFNSLTLLEELNLGNNFIEVIEDGSFHGLGNLLVLDLHSNTLSSVESEMISGINMKVQILDLRFNPFECDCKLLWLQKWLLYEASKLSNTTRLHLHQETYCVSHLNDTIYQIVDISQEDCDQSSNREDTTETAQMFIKDRPRPNDMMVIWMLVGIVIFLFLVVVFLCIMYPGSFSKETYVYPPPYNFCSK